jgi:hypothetical protein
VCASRNGGEVTDISAFLSFHFWQEVFYQEPNKKTEKLGRWVGVANKHGDARTYLILTDDGLVNHFGCVIEMPDVRPRLRAGDERQLALLVFSSYDFICRCDRATSVCFERPLSSTDEDQPHKSSTTQHQQARVLVVISAACP